MAILTQDQLVAASNATYFDNISGSITPTAVRTLNDSWISSSITADVTSSMTVGFARTASFLLGTIASASYALQAQNANNALVADTATFATSAGTANSAVTASFALNFNPAATASYAINAATASFLSGSITNAVSASYALSASFASIANTASYALNASSSFPYTGSARITGSLTLASLTPLNVSHVKANDVQGVEILTNSGTTVATFGAGGGTGVTVVGQVNAASFSGSGALISGIISSSRAISAANADNATSASYASNAELLDGLNFTAFVLTSSFVPFSSSVSDRFNAAPTLAGNNTFLGTNNFNIVSASYIQALSASIDYLSVIYQTSSVVYSSGSNIFGDAASDVQTLYGTVDIKTGPLVVTGSIVGLNQKLLISGSTTLKPQYVVTDYPFTINEVADASAASANIISNRNTGATTTGSFTVSGSNNILLLSAGASNANTLTGNLFGFNGRGNIVLNTNINVSGSNPSKVLVTANASTLASVGTIVDNRPSTTATPLTFTNSYLNGALAYTTSTGSTSFNNVTIAGSTTLTVTGSVGTTKAFTTVLFNGGANTFTIDSPTSNGVASALLVAGNSNSLLSSGSNYNFGSTSILGLGLNVTGSEATPGVTFVGRYNAQDSTAILANTVFAVGTGTSTSVRRTSFHVSSSGLTTVSNNLLVSGSVNGNVVSASIASNTSSIDFSQGNFYTSLVTGTTNFNITNPKAGQTLNLLLTTAGTGASASFSSNVKQVSGSVYAPTATNGAQDILTFISWDGTSVYLANVKNLI